MANSKKKPFLKIELKSILTQMENLKDIGTLEDEDYDKIVKPIFHLQNKLAIIEKEGEDAYLKTKENKYYLHDNLKRYFLADMLIRDSCLKGLKIEELDRIVQNISTLTGNLAHSVKNGDIKISVEDRHNHSGSSFFRNIILHNVLDIPIEHNGSERDFKDKLKTRWGIYDKVVDKL